jgi:polyphosphate kinase
MGRAEPRFLNRELSWLEFNQRVLEEARDPSNPPLERLKFLAITGSNLDEFFMVRVGGLQQLLEQGKNAPDPAGLTTEDQLAQISWRTHRMVAEQQACLRAIEPLLAAGGMRRMAMEDLSPEQTQQVAHTFDHDVFPLLTPLAATAAAFPRLPPHGVCLGVRLVAAAGRRGRKPRVALVPIPRSVNRFLSVEVDRGWACVLIEEVVRAHIGRLFPGETVLEVVPFRITRNADMEVREDQAGDLLEQMRRVLDRRRESACVRLELSSGASAEFRAFLKEALAVPARDLYESDGPLDLSAFLGLAALPGFDRLRDAPWEPQPLPPAAAADSVFALMARQDVLLCPPFDAFDPVLRLVEEAADDPDVLAIKQTLYRTSRSSPVVAALARAAEQGKQVTAVVELKARFDEARNIEWARALEQSGAQVIYGIRGLKTHAKVCLVIRREPHGVRRYVQFGTGNYNEITARLYTDVSLMTCNEDLAADASLFFNTITGRTQSPRYAKLDAAPTSLRSRLLALIETEAMRCREGQPGHIMAKLNSLADPTLIEALYTASQAGVTIELNVRGICCLRPGVPGLSETISVVSIVDRFLEHSRILYFRHGGEPRVFISSADWMPRNLDRRIELLVPVEDAACRQRLVTILRTCLADTLKGRRLLPDGRYVPAQAEGGAAVRSQAVLYEEAGARTREADAARRQVFEPLRPAAEGGR